jgi:hypothetical protein
MLKASEEIIRILVQIRYLPLPVVVKIVVSLYLYL